jgi:hypothetical protein
LNGNGEVPVGSMVRRRSLDKGDAGITALLSKRTERVARAPPARRRKKGPAEIGGPFREFGREGKR